MRKIWGSLIMIASLWSFSAWAATYYISPTGDDLNSGLSEGAPWKTLAKVSSRGFTAGDKVLLQGGQTFTGCLAFNAGRITSNRAQPFTLGSYGTGKFTLVANCTGAAIKIVGVNGFILQDAIIVGNGGAATYGVWLYNYSAASSGGIVIQRNDISGFYAKGAAYGAEIFISSDGPYGAMDDIKVLNNVLHGSAGPTSPDDNGIMGRGHGNIKNVLYQGNHVFNIGGHPGAPNGTVGNGIVAIGVTGAILQNNLVHDLGANTNTCGGPGGVWTVESSNVLIQFNEAYNVRPINKTTGCDWVGFDIDNNVSNATVQYNYSHNNYGPGYLAFGFTGVWNNNVFRYNLSVNDGAGIGVNLTAGKDLVVYNNTFFVGGPGSLLAAPTAFSIGSNSPDTGLVANNNFYATGNAMLLNDNGRSKDGLVFDNNNYFASSAANKIAWKSVVYPTVAAWKLARGADLYAMNVNPGFKSAGAAPTCSNYNAVCATGYQLSESSPLLGKGINLLNSKYAKNPGSRDLYGNAIPNKMGSGFNVGAYGGQPPPISTDKITVYLSQDKNGADALARITIDGKVLGDKLPVPARHLVGMNQFTYQVPKMATHEVVVTFLNDDNVNGDKRLYVDAIKLNDVSSGQKRTLFTNGSAKFAIGITDQITVRMSEDAYISGHALVVVDIVEADGVKRVADPISISASHAAKATQALTFKVKPAASHKIRVTYVNDIKDAKGDRNLYVDSISFKSRTIPGAAMLTNGYKEWTIAP